MTRVEALLAQAETAADPAQLIAAARALLAGVRAEETGPSPLRKIAT